MNIILISFQIKWCWISSRVLSLSQWLLLEQSWKSSKSWTWIIFCWDTKTWFIFLRISFLIRANEKFLSDFLWSWLDICLHSRSNSWMSLIKLRIDFSSVKMLESTIFWLRLLKVFLYNMRLSAVNLIFDWVVTYNDNTWIKHSVLKSVLLIWQLYCLSVSNAAVASLLTRVDIRSSICHEIESFLQCSSSCFTI